MTTLRWVTLACLLAAGLAAAVAQAEGWEHYGGDASLAEITPANVAELEIAWILHHGDVSDGSGAITSTTAFQATPILADGTLFFCTPMNRVIALDPATGAERWSFDPGVDTTVRYGNQLTCRGVATWLDAGRQAGAGNSSGVSGRCAGAASTS